MENLFEYAATFSQDVLTDSQLNKRGEGLLHKIENSVKKFNINVDSYDKLMANLMEFLDQEIYLNLKKRIPSNITHRLGYKKELFKESIEKYISRRLGINSKRH